MREKHNCPVDTGSVRVKHGHPVDTGSVRVKHGSPVDTGSVHVKHSSPLDTAASTTQNQQLTKKVWALCLENPDRHIILHRISKDIIDPDLRIFLFNAAMDYSRIAVGFMIIQGV